MEPYQSQALEWPRKRELKRLKKEKREPAWELEEDLSKELSHPGSQMGVISSCSYHPRGGTQRSHHKRGDQRFSLDDDTAASVFTITITDLRPEDGGTYWCGIQRPRPLPDDYTEILLLVEQGFIILCVCVALLISGIALGVLVLLFKRRKPRGLQSDLGWTTAGGAVAISPTSYFPLAHSFCGPALVQVVDSQ
ncbi:hypothetical protein MHYP_G00101760 [Metynnis hypsauchen]